MKFLSCIVMVLMASSVYAQEDSVTSLQENEYTYPTEEGDENTEGGEQVDEASTPAHTLVAPENLPRTAEYKTETIPVKKFDRQKWKEIVGKTAYTEKQVEQKTDDKEKAENIPPVNLPWATKLLQPLFYVLIIGIIGLLIYFVVRNASSLTYKLKKDSLSSEDITKPIENIEELDVNTLLQDALATGNLKLAIRLYYLALLKKLHEAGIIDWKKDKTNRDYLDELFFRNYQYDEIRHLTRTYEEVWYGDHGITRELFDKISVRFENVREQINISRQP